jgi:sulfonate transport system ATP-binding protein
MSALPVSDTPSGSAPDSGDAAGSGADGAFEPGRIELRGVTRTFGRQPGVTALDRVDLSVAPGEFVSLLGASGCGKSTLLSLVAGLDAPTLGTVRVGGGQPALMFQESALFPWLTAQGNVELALRLRGVPRGDRAGQALDLLDQVHLRGVADRRAHELSGGQRQRVAMARSLAQGARVLLMDEPFAALDAITRDHLHSELIALWQEKGFSVVFVTHNVREAVRLGQRIILLSSRPGRVVQEWKVSARYPRALDEASVGRLTRDITARLREEITRHA